MHKQGYQPQAYQQAAMLWLPGLQAITQAYANQQPGCQPCQCGNQVDRYCHCQNGFRVVSYKLVKRHPTGNAFFFTLML